MNNIENFIINAILIIFPILIYGYFVAYLQNIKKKKRNTLFNIFLYMSFYLAIMYKNYSFLEYQFMSIIIPIMISYLHNSKINSILMSIIVTIYSITFLNFKFYIIIPFFILLFLLYEYYSKRNKNKLFFTLMSTLLLSLAVLINFLHSFNTELLLVTIHAICIYTVSIIIINFGIEESNNVINLHSNLKEFEKDKDLRLSIFKITHEIKNPLAVIKGYLCMFDVKDIKKSRRYLKIMNNELERTLNLLNDFLEFSKIKINIKETNINSLIDELKDILIPLFNAKNVEYNFRIEKNIKVNIDGIRMKQVILNIIKNAIEACTPYKGIVKINIYKDNNQLVISVRDNGEGMSKETLDNITTPFVTTKEYGTGLGVSLSNEIIKAHNGSLKYSSIIKKGTTCKIVLPLKNQ